MQGLSASRRMQGLSVRMPLALLGRVQSALLVQQAAGTRR
jgi:hypothetical protein